MKQLSGLDASFLYMETPSQFGHVSSLSIFEKPDDPNYDAFSAWRAQIDKRLHTLEPLRRRLRNVPMNLDHPFWIDDPDFDLDFHVRNTATPPPGSDQQLADLVARIIGRPLDRTRPLWETYVIEGLPDDRFGILTKVHHSTIDGASGAELLTMMLDQSPEGDDVPPPEEEWNPAPEPSDAEVLARAGANLARKPGRAILLSTRVIREFGKSTRNPALVAAANQVRGGLRGPLGALLNIGRERTPEGETKGPLPSLSAPTRPSTRRSPRTAGSRSAPTSLESVKAIKNALGATVNDVVMAVCAGGLRTWLEDHDALPDQPAQRDDPGVDPHRRGDRAVEQPRLRHLRRPPDRRARSGEACQRVHESMNNAKELFDAIPADSLTDFAQFPPPAVFARAMRLSTRLMTRNSPINLVISNVPGPRQPLYAAGSRLLHYYPVSTITDGQGLNVTVQSYLDSLDFGLVSCRELVPDLWDMLDAIINDLAALGKATGVDVPL